MNKIFLRPYQQDFIDNVRNEFLLKHKRVVGVAPCGAGKTIMTGWMIRESARRGKKSIFFVHRKELIDQTAKTFCDLQIPFGVICSGVKSDFSLPVQIATVQTLATRIDSVKKSFKPDFLICDECHHILANTYKKILNAFPDAFLLGVTATPQRMGGVTLHDVFESMVCSLSVNQLIELGNLTKFQYFAAPLDVDLRGIRIKNGDFDTNDLEDVMTSSEITGDIITHYLNFARDKSAICYCVNVNHSKKVADAFNSAGISAAHVDGDTKKDIRAKLVDEFRQGKIQVLCNAELFGEGFDVPRCQAVILARPTKSLTLFIQQSMRAMRPDPDDPNKVAVIIDCVQNRERHGLPNAFHEWTLDPNAKKFVKCPHCGDFISLATFRLVPPDNGEPIEDLSPIDFEVDGNKILLQYHQNGSPIKISVKEKIFFNSHFEEIREVRIFTNKKFGHLRRICPKCGYLFPLEESRQHEANQPQHRNGSISELTLILSTLKLTIPLSPRLKKCFSSLKNFPIKPRKKVTSAAGLLFNLCILPNLMMIVSLSLNSSTTKKAGLITNGKKFFNPRRFPAHKKEYSQNA